MALQCIMHVAVPASGPARYIEPDSRQQQIVQGFRIDKCGPRNPGQSVAVCYLVQCIWEDLKLELKLKQQNALYTAKPFTCTYLGRLLCDTFMVNMPITCKDGHLTLCIAVQHVAAHAGRRYWPELPRPHAHGLTLR